MLYDKRSRWALYNRAWKQWKRLQYTMVIEECAELIHALTKFERGRCGINAVAEEAADVELMIEQLRALSPKINDRIDSFKKTKLVRLEVILDAEDKKRRDSG